MREELQLLDEAGDARLDLNLNDIHSITHPARLREWTEAAIELSEAAGSVSEPARGSNRPRKAV